MAIKDRIKQLRQEKKWSQAQLGSKMGCHQKQVSAYERGRNIPSTDGFNETFIIKTKLMNKRPSSLKVF